MKGEVMTNRITRHIYVFITLLAIITSVHSQHVSRSLCGGRCESSIPHFQILRTVWNKLSKQTGVSDKSYTPFEAFLKSLMVSAERHHRLKPVRDLVVKMISRYYDCTNACEHQYGKRNIIKHLFQVGADNSMNVRNLE